MNIIWHDLECGSYTEDMGFWRSLADREGDPVLDVGAGAGRVALDLATRGHRVTALDRDSELLDELTRRANGFTLDTVRADARMFDLQRRFALCVVPMQTIQLLGGREGRLSFLRCAKRHLTAGGLLAIAIAETLELFELEAGGPAPLPDICERDGIVYSSQPTAVRMLGDQFVLERRRETITAAGERSIAQDVIHLDRLTQAQLGQEAVEAGLRGAGDAIIRATDDYVGSTVVMVRA
jgi:SAM-dependent methyltransferase